MNFRGVLFLLGRIQLALAIMLAIPAAVGYFVDGAAVKSFLGCAIVVGLIGILFEWLFRQPADFAFSRREAFLLVSSAWIVASLVGALPYVVIKGPGFAVNALFESASGFTTTGASILSGVEGEPAALLLWRSLTQWLGGMGIIVLGIAILPKLAVGGMELLGAEAPGPIAEKLTPRIAQTAKALWGIYALLTAATAGALVLAGVGTFDAVCHAFTTVATGGFSTLNASVGGFDNRVVEAIIALFMVISGVNFALHFRVLRGKPLLLLRDPEFRIYAILLAGVTLLLAGDLLLAGHGSESSSWFRLAAFQAASFVSTTGFSTADFSSWPAFSCALLFALLFVGGCAGSTSGSVKIARVMIVAKKLAVDIKRLVRPNAVLPVRLGRMSIPDEIVTSVTTFFILFIVVFAVGGLTLSAFGLDAATAFSASAACLSNFGPGFGSVGPASNYAALPAPVKLVLVVLMIVGRLELYTVLVTIYLSRRLFRT